jgi:hypothetical protein
MDKHCISREFFILLSSLLEGGGYLLGFDFLMYRINLMSWASRIRVHLDPGDHGDQIWRVLRREFNSRYCVAVLNVCSGQKNLTVLSYHRYFEYHK